MKISDILRHKGSAVVTIAPTAAVPELLQKLAEHGIGALVVTDGAAVVGIVSERDVVRRLHERGAGVLTATVAQIMTAAVVTCASHDAVDCRRTT